MSCSTHTLKHNSQHTVALLMKQVFYMASLHQVCTNVCPRSVNAAIHTRDKRDWLIKVPATWTVNTTTSTTVITVSAASLQEWASWRCRVCTATLSEMQNTVVRVHVCAPVLEYTPKNSSGIGSTPIKTDRISLQVEVHHWLR